MSSIVDARQPISSISVPRYWLMMIPIGVSIVLLATLTYRFLEYPFIKAHHPTPAPQKEPVVV